MHIDLLLDIIQKGVGELKQITDNFKLETPNSQEIDIATSKTETLLKELKLLQGKVTIKDVPDVTAKNSDIFEAPVNRDEATVSSVENPKEFPVDNTEQEIENLPKEINVDKETILSDEVEITALNITRSSEDKVIGETISPSKNLSDLININDKFQFTRELFENNNTLYIETIDKLNTVSTFENAKKIISSFNWNEEDETVMHFLEILTRKFTYNV